MNEARQRALLQEKQVSGEHSPPTQDALFQHTKWAIIQSNIWTTSLSSIQNIPSPREWGWKKEDNSWKPVRMTIAEAAKACSELVKCGCKSQRGCASHCVCMKAGLSCTDLCDCRCEVDGWFNYFYHCDH